MSNVVNAVFGATKKTKTGPIFQYDYGNKLQFVDVELPSSYEVHFSNYNYGDAKTVLGDSTGVEIPYEYTKNYGRVFAWVFIHENEDVGWTKYLAEIPVIQRAKPSYDPVDPYEQSIVEQLASTVKVLQGDVSGVQDDVETLQQTATQIATNTQDINNLNSAVEGVQEDVATNTQDINNLNSAVEGVQEDVATNTQDINNLNSAVEGVQEDVQTLQKKKADVIVSSASGAVATFSDGADGMPLESLKCYIEPVQDLHGYDSPWPAGGGKNLLPPGSDRLSNGITFTVNNDGTVTANGTASNIAFWSAQFTIPAGTYIHSGCPSGVSGVTCDIRNANGGAGISGIGTDGGKGVTFTISETLTAWYNIRVQSGTTLTNVVVKPMIRLASETDATFAPYSNICPVSGWTEAKVCHSGEDTDNPDVLSITFPTEAGTVYGGTLDVTTGVLTVDKGFVMLDGSETWSKRDDGQYYVRGVSNDAFVITRATQASVIGVSSNKYVGVTWSNFQTGTNCVSLFYGQPWIIIQDSRYEDIESLKADLADNPLQVCYELATPITYQLTPQQLNTLLGNNNIWADTGDTTVKYTADTKLYIDGKIAELQALVLEN